MSNPNCTMCGQPVKPMDSYVGDGEDIYHLGCHLAEGDGKPRKIGPLKCHYCEAPIHDGQRYVDHKTAGFVAHVNHADCVRSQKRVGDSNAPLEPPKPIDKERLQYFMAHAMPLDDDIILDFVKVFYDPKPEEQRNRSGWKLVAKAHARWRRMQAEAMIKELNNAGGT